MAGIEASDDEDFSRAIYKHQVGLKDLEVREVNLDRPHRWRMLRALHDLKTLIGRFKPLPELDSDSYQVNLTCRLNRFVSTSPIAASTFVQVLYSSSTSLTSLAFVIDPSHAELDLNRFKNLKTLRIAMEDDVSMTLRPSRFGLILNRRLFDIHRAQLSTFTTQIRKILGSTLSLRLETFSLTVQDGYVAEVMAPDLLLDILPPSLRHLGTVLEFLDPEGPNYSEMVGRLPHLEKITIFPTGSDSVSHRQPPDAATQRRFSELETRLGINVTSHRNSAGLITSWYTLEPYVEETDEEEEDEDEEGSE